MQTTPGLVRWTRAVVAHRRSVLAVWAVLFVLGGWATSNLGSLLTNRFSVPGSEAERGLEILHSRLHQRGDGGFTLVAQTPAQAAGAQGSIDIFAVGFGGCNAPEGMTISVIDPLVFNTPAVCVQP